MSSLEHISTEELRNALDEVERKTPAVRLVAAIAHTHGVTQSELAEWFDVERKTVYNWFDRLDAADLVESARDERRPGRPRKLGDDQLASFRDIVSSAPGEAGYDAEVWTTEMVQHLLRDTFSAEYSEPSCRRLLREAGLRAIPATRAATGDGRARYVWVSE